MDKDHLPFLTNTRLSHSYTINGVTQTYTDEYTDNLQNLTYVGDGQPFDKYALGYISTDNLPDLYRRSTVKYDHTNNKVIFKTTTPDGNYPCGYLNNYHHSFGCNEFTWVNGNLNRHGPENSTIRFINQLYPELSNSYATGGSSFSISLRGNLWYTPLNTPRRNDFYDSIDFDNQTDFLEFLEGTSTKEYTITTFFEYGGTRFDCTFKITSETFNATQFRVYAEEDSSIYWTGFIAAFQFYSIGGDNAFAVKVPGTDYDDNDGSVENDWVVTGNAFGQLSGGVYGIVRDSGGIRQEYNRMGAYTNSGATYDCAGGWEGEFNYYDNGGVAEAGVYLVADGNVACIKQSGLNNVHWFFRIFTLREIKQTYDLYLYREAVYNNTDPSYFTDKNTAIEVDPNDRFYAARKNGDIDDEGFRESLRPWQYIDRTNPDPADNGINVNPFDPETDIPEYEPDEPPGPVNPDDPDEGPPDGEPEEGPDKDERGDDMGPGASSGYYPADPSPFVKYGFFTYADLMQLSEQLWNKPDGFFESIAAQQKVNPMDYFISLRWYPFEGMAGFFDSSPASEIVLGRGGSLFTEYELPNRTIMIYDCGGLVVQPYYNNFLDYAPYTQIFITLPYCGQFELNPTIVMRKLLRLKMIIDITDGSIIWELWNETDGQQILTKQGRIGCEVPINSINASQMASNIVNATMGVTNAVIGAGQGLLTGAAMGAGVGSVVGPAGTIAGGIVGSISGILSTGSNLISSMSAMGLASKEIITKSGASTGMATSGTQRYAFLTYQRPLATNPKSYGHDTGYLCNKQRTISSMKGFTICKNVDTSGISTATEKEKEMIKQTLDSGFYN